MRQVEVGVNDFLYRGHSHGGVIESSAEINVVAADTFEPDERIVPDHVRIIAGGILEIGWKRRQQMTRSWYNPLDCRVVTASSITEQNS